MNKILKNNVIQDIIKANYCIKSLFQALAIIASVLITPAFGQNVAEPSPAQQLVALFGNSSSMQADVEQLTLDQGGNEVQEIRAKLLMQKPNQFYWELTEPYPELLVTNGEKIWRYEPDLDQVTIQAFDDDLSNTPFLLLNGDLASLNESFEISMGILPDQSSVRFVLLPLDPASPFINLSLTFQGDILREMQFENSLGSKTSLYFHNMETNIAIDESVFKFDPPPGIDIIDTTRH